MEVLGATKYGNYDDSLEFFSSQPLPVISSSQDVLIQIAYTDINPVDLQKLHGNKNFGRPIIGTSTPFIPGYGGSGTIIDVGQDVPTEWKGRDVCFIADPTRPGSYATHILVDSRCVAMIPMGVSLREAASIPVAGLTAYESLHKVGFGFHPHEGSSGGGGRGRMVESTKYRTLLIIGGAGGVGSWIISLARAWYPNLEIIATASTKDQQDWCQTLGADVVMPHEDIKQQLPCGSQGSVDAIICLTEPTTTLFGTCADVIRPYGSICLVVSGQSIQSLDMSFIFFKCATVTTETVFSSIRTKYQNIIPSEELAIMLTMLSEGRLRAPISPDLLSGKVHEDFKDALTNDGVLYALSQPTGRRGKFVLKVT